ncbi:MAG: hypothetical protein LBT05_07180, partial [Planctomycetaceae bacterium]|nr:hypothetical protein [Planctomycetaceae bacterium]
LYTILGSARRHMLNEFEYLCDVLRFESPERPQIRSETYGTSAGQVEKFSLNDCSYRIVADCQEMRLLEQIRYGKQRLNRR